MISVAQIVGLAGMNERPEYYSGRGIRTEDLDANKLYHIYEIIKEQISETAANSFAWMVAGTISAWGRIAEESKIKSFLHDIHLSVLSLKLFLLLYGLSPAKVQNG